MKRRLLWAVVLLGLTSRLVVAQGTLVQSMISADADRAARTLFFDLHALASDVTLCRMDVAFGSNRPQARTATGTIEVYHHVPGSGAQITSPVGWMLDYSETAASVLSGGSNELRALVLANPIFIPAGTSVRFAIHGYFPDDPTAGVLYREGSQMGSQSGPHLRLDDGGITTQNTQAFEPVVAFFWNAFSGTLYYELGSSCSGNPKLPSLTVGPTLHDGPGGGGPFKAGCVTVIQGNGLGRATIPPGSTLTVEPGAIVKFLPGVQLEVQGQLDAEGSHWTSYLDDGPGGDTNGDGNQTLPTPGEWQNISFNSMSVGSIETSVFEYGGGPGAFGSSHPVLDVNGAQVDIVSCTLRNNDGNGHPTLDFNGNAPPAQVENNYIVNNGGRAIGNVPMGSLGGFRNNIAMGNAEGNALEAVAQTAIPCAGGPRDVTGQVELTAGTSNGGVLVVRGRVCVQPGGRLVLGPDTKIKFDPSVRSGIEVQPGGTLEIRGTPSREVCITSLADDSIGGDTNGDGPSVGNPGDWEGIKYTGTPVGTGPQGCVENAVLRFTGASLTAIPATGLEVNGPDVDLDSVRVEKGLGDGFGFPNGRRATNLAALYNGGNGFRMGGNGLDLDLSYATARGNAGHGIVADPGYLGTVDSSNSFDNLGANFQSVAAVLRSNGFTGASPAGAGNMNVPPQWRDAESASILPTSPLVDQGSLSGLLTRAYDLYGASGSNGSAPDIGAAEASTRRLKVSGMPVQGEGLMIDIDPETPQTETMLALSLNPSTTVVPGLGTLAGGTDLSTYLLLGPFVGPQSIPLPLPLDPCVSLDGIDFSIQGFGSTANGGVELTNAWTGTIQGWPASPLCP